jgi:TPR repeat protein
MQHPLRQLTLHQPPHQTLPLRNLRPQMLLRRQKNIRLLQPSPIPMKNRRQMKTQPKPAAKAPLAKPPAAKPVDAVAEAQRYIYGRGVHQDCDHGLRLLKSAQSNPTAMISLGALYSTGTCTPRDLPTAYRWFALALHKQPENQALQDDLQKLWSQMTQPERQLAIKLSQ